MRTKSLRSQNTHRDILIFSFVVIPVLLLILFKYYPAAKLLYYSFTNYDGMAADIDFVGLRNWNILLGSAESWETLSHALYYIVGGVVQNAVALLLAVILNKKVIKGRNIFRGLIVLPFVLNGTAISYMFRYVFDYSKGPLNLARQALGLEPVSWLGSPELVNWSLAFVALWRYTGYLMIIYLAALQTIPNEYYEAARIDGCSAFRQLTHITIPLIQNVIKLQMFLNISGAVNIFDIPFVITGGGPSGASQTLTMQANAYAFTFKNYGMASAYGVFCTVIVIIIYLTQDKLLYRKEEK